MEQFGCLLEHTDLQRSLLLEHCLNAVAPILARRQFYKVNEEIGLA